MIDDKMKTRNRPFLKEIALKPNRQQLKLDNLFFGAHAPLRRALNLAILAIIYPPSLLANPDGAQIISGQVSIDTSSPGVANITNSPNAIIQWQNFNIAQNEITRFIQQNGQSAVLNRIIGENPSAILGQLASNGKVLLINPNGIVFGANSVIDTQGLIASSLNLSDQDFFSGNYHFIAGSNAGSIVNEGIIRAGKDGNIILIAPSINNNGIIKTEGGQITLAAGQNLVLTNLDDPDIRFEIQAPGNAVLNLGKLLTEGGAVNVFANTITHSGEINADSVSIDAQGNIKLVAEQHINLTQDSKLSANNSSGDAGTISVESKAGTVFANGAIEAKATETGKGGNISLLGEHINVLNQAGIDAGGANGGGQVSVGDGRASGSAGIHNAKSVYIGADTAINADAKTSGNGGNVSVWSDNATLAYGHISAKGGEQDGNGGVIQTSGHELDTSGILVDASAVHGKAGKWRLSADNINIVANRFAAGAGNTPKVATEQPVGIATAGSIQSALNNGTAVAVNTDTAGADANGDISVDSAISKNAGGDAALSFSARNNITVNAAVESTAGKLNVTFVPDSDAAGGGATHINRAVDLNAGLLTLHGNSTVSERGAIKNATLTLPDLADTELNGVLSHVDTVNINKGAQLTINHGNAAFDGQFNNSGTLAINAFFVMDALNIDGGLLTGRGGVKVNDRFEFHSGILEGTGLLTTAAGSTTTLADGGTAYLGRQWNNYGTINWQGAAAFSPHGDNSVLNNGSGGVFNIGGAKAGGSREINMAQFNNAGTLNLSGGLLKIISPGTDAGDYQVSGSGELQFWYGTRIFVSGADVDSDNAVTFANGVNTFRNGSGYSAPQTDVISFGTVNFNTGTAINLASLTLDTGTLGGSDAVTINDTFMFHSGNLSGSGLFTTAATAATTLADTGTVYLNKHWDNLGTLTWQGIADVIDNDTTTVFNNAAGGVFNIGSPGLAADRVLELNTARFNNHGLLNLSGGLLKIVSSGTDTGDYHVSGNGQLQFWYGTRIFGSGASVNSINTVTFANGIDHFNHGSTYNAAQTDVMSFGTVNFNTGTAVNLAALTMDTGSLGGSDAVNVNDTFMFHSGSLNGVGLFTTAATAATTLADTGTVYLSKRWDNLGTLTWQGIADVVDNNRLAVINNVAGGVFNIGNSNRTSDSILELSIARFNNQGTLNLSSGVLKIFSDGTDTGDYNVTDTGRLQFWNGTRNFNSGATINSINDVAFVNGNGYFKEGAGYNAADTLIDNATVTFNTGNTIKMPMLTIDNFGSLSGADDIQVGKALVFYSGFLGGDGMITTQAGSTITLTEGIALLNRDWDNYGTINFGVTHLSDLARISDSELGIKNWNNYGTILWRGPAGSTSDIGKNIILTNKPGGLYDISSDDPSSVREINIGAFNNQGTLNLFGGILKIFSPGMDTGRYNVSGTGQVQFHSGERAFSGARINSENAVSFIGGTHLFNNGAVYNAPETRIENATISFDSAVSFGNLSVSDSLLNNTDRLTVNGKFDWAGGILSGNGTYKFNNGFNYTAGSLLANGSVIINDHSGSLLLPAMPLINRLSARSSGALILDGGITASGSGTAILLAAGTRFDNSAGAILSAPNGRWLVYSDNPGVNTLGGLTADFKHYGCNTEACNDGFNVPAASGDGLLYSIIPVLTVTPDNLSSIYGGSANFSSTSAYTGFIDGDSAEMAGITGNTHFTSNATTSSSGHYNAGTHDIAYAGGLASALGYQFQDNETSTGEWTITPQDLNIIAQAAGKIYGERDPVFGYDANGLLDGDVLSGGLNRIAGENVGQYSITQGSLANPNYSINYTDAELSITPRSLSIIADALSKLRGERDPMFTYIAEGLIEGDGLSGELSRIAGERIGRYAITLGSLAAGPNYTIAYTPANLTIKPEPRHIPEEPVQEQINKQQNQVLISTKPDTFTLALDDSPVAEPETTAPKRLKQCK